MTNRHKDELKRIVIKLSGSLFGPDLKADILKSFCALFEQHVKKKVQFIIVAGGGYLARRYISIARSLGADEGSLDEIGIETSRLNAWLIISALGTSAYSLVPRSLDEVLNALNGNRIVVLGGLHPGHSTNATAALVAERCGACIFINATDVDGVYTADPSLQKTAKKLKTVTIGRLTKIMSEGKMTAGTYELMDLVALKIIERSTIPTRIVRCSFEEIQGAIEGRNVGTLLITGDSA
jgi:uridylate kinase